MSDRLPDEILRRIEEHVDALLRGAGLPDSARAEARADFVDHLEAGTREHVHRGLAPGEALDRAIQRFGDRDVIRLQLAAGADGRAEEEGWAHSRVARPPRRGPLVAVATWWGDLAQDLRLAARQMAIEPGFTATVILTIAVGIAATTTIFSVVDGTLLRPLPYPEPDRIVAIWPSFWFSNSSFELLQRALDPDDSAFAAISGSSPRNARYRDADGVRSIGGRRVTARFLDVLGPVMSLGRTFSPDANEPGGEREVVLTDGFWRRELDADPAIIGKVLTFEGTGHTVVGVLAPGYDLLGPDAEVVLPKVFERNSVGYRSDEMKGFGRLRPEATLAQANAELEAIVAGWKEQYGLPDDFGAEFRIVPLRDYLVGDVRSTILLLFGSVTLILLIAAANVVSLLLTRGIARRREVSVRLALGARPSRIVRQLLAETSLLALLGGAVGLLAALAAVRAVVQLLPADTPRLAAIEVDSGVVLFATALALATGWLVAVAPALRVVSTRLRDSLTATGRGITTSQHTRRIIVAGELALAVMLLVGAGLLLKSFWQLNRQDTGVREAGLVTFYVGAAPGHIASHDEARAFHAQVRDRIAGLPGVSGLSTISQAPFNLDGGVVGCRAFDQSDPDADNENQCRWRTVGPDYFEVAGTPLREGRLFHADDTEGAAPVAIISREAERTLFSGDSALGKPVATSFEAVVEDGRPWATVVGVVDDVRFLGLAERAPLLVYRPEVQAGAIIDRFGFYGSEYMIRADPGVVSLEAVRAAVRAVDPYAVVSGFTSMQQLIANSVADRRALLVLMSAFTVAALFLGAIGVYGITTHGVRSRSHELSIKMALGASRGDVVSEVFVDGFKVTIAGVLAGLALALALARFIESFLYEVKSADPWVLGVATVFAISVSTVATWIPARRTAASNPSAALAAE